MLVDYKYLENNFKSSSLIIFVYMCVYVCLCVAVTIGGRRGYQMTWNYSSS